MIFAKTHKEKQWLIGLGIVCMIGIAIYYFLLDGMATAAGVAIVSIFVGGVLPLAKAMPAQLPDIKVEHVGAAGGLHSTMQNAMAFIIPSFIVGPLITGADGTMNYDMVQYCYIALTGLMVIAALFLPKLATGGAAPAEEKTEE